MHAIGRAAIQQGYRVIYRGAHTLLEELADATLAGTRKDYVAELAVVPLLINDELGTAERPLSERLDCDENVIRHISAKLASTQACCASS